MSSIFLKYTLDEKWNILNVETALADDMLFRLKGRSLFAIVSDPTLRHLLARIFEGVWELNKNVALQYRCDTPELRRNCLMRVTRRVEGNHFVLDVENSILTIEERKRVDLLDAKTERSAESVAICSWCKKIQCEGDRWLEIEHAAAVMGILNQVPAPTLRHGMCPVCKKYLMDEAQALKPS